jgi:multidrug resistance efflux pump
VSRYEVDIAKSQLSQQKALLAESKIMASFCNVRAPFAGGIVSVDINAHEAVSSGVPLLKIVDDSEIVMSLNIPSIWINNIEKGDFFTIIVDETSNSYKAKVTGISPAIDPVSKTIELRAVLAKRFPELSPGMSGRARLNFSKN